MAAGSEPQKCHQDVLARRQKAKDENKISVGVEPPVGMGPALLIFLLVGIFAAGIAQAFQMVR